MNGFIELLESRLLLSIGPVGAPVLGDNRTLESNVAVAPDGAYVLVWYANQQYLAQLFDKNGAAINTNFVVTDPAWAGTEGIKVAIDAQHNIVVGWSTSTDVFARWFAPDGTSQSDLIHLNSPSPYSCFGMSLASNAAGDLVATWDGFGTGDDRGIYAQRFGPAGAARGDPFLVNTITSEIQGNPSVGMNASGDFVISWFSTAGGKGLTANIEAQRFTAAGVPIGSEFRANFFTDNAGRDNPQTALADDGSFMIGWANGSGTASHSSAGRVFSADGTPQANESAINLAPSTNGTLFAISPDNRGAFLALWGDHAGAHLRRFGTGLSSELLMNTILPAPAPALYQRGGISANSSGSGDFVATWVRSFDNLGNFS